MDIADIARINPNTKTAPVFRARADAELTAKIYSCVPVLIDEAKGAAGNLWGVSFHTRIWHMADAIRAGDLLADGIHFNDHGKRDLAQLVAAKQFRADLYYRLDVIPICLPPLLAIDGSLADSVNSMQ